MMSLFFSTITACMAQDLFLGVVGPQLTPAIPTIPTRKLPGGGELPSLYMGNWGGQTNFTEWLQIAGPGAGIQTAYVYGVQAQIPEQIAAAGLTREDIFLSTMIPCGGYDGGVEPMNRTMAEWYIGQDLEQLNTSYIDLVFLHHRCRTPEETHEVWGALENMRRRGQARDIGVANFDVADLKALQEVATEPIAANQGHFSLGSMDFETLEFCDAHGIVPISYSSLTPSVPMNDPTLVNTAQKHNVSTYQLLLRYVSLHGLTILSSASKVSHMIEDADIFNFDLAQVDMRALDSLQVGKRTCPDCFTIECQTCSFVLQEVGCPVQDFPTFGRGNPNGQACLTCAGANNETVLKVCGEESMVAKGCGI